MNKIFGNLMNKIFGNEYYELMESVIGNWVLGIFSLFLVGFIFILFYVWIQINWDKAESRAERDLK